MPLTDNIIDDDLGALDAFLVSEATAEDCMTLPIADGFLTAVAIGPELVMPSEWLPLVWGSHTPEWASPDEAELICGIIMERYNEILHTVRGGKEAFEPIFAYDYRFMRPDCEEWSFGFMQGFALCREAWGPLLESKAHRGYIAAITVHQMSEKEVREADAGEGNLIYMWENGAKVIPEAVVGIDRFWKRVRGYYERKEKTGRNDPCPCGSGKKFKKCCGNH